MTQIYDKQNKRESRKVLICVCETGGSQQCVGGEANQKMSVRLCNESSNSFYPRKKFRWDQIFIIFFPNFDDNWSVKPLLLCKITHKWHNLKVWYPNNYLLVFEKENKEKSNAKNELKIIIWFFHLAK